MMIRSRENQNDGYLGWIYDLVCGDRFPPSMSYRKLLWMLNDMEFVYSIPRDVNRAKDGISLRDRYYRHREYDGEHIVGPCSVLEMMVALAIRCEENIMDDPAMGNRTGQWFWEMIGNLGLRSMTDSRFDPEYVAMSIDRFLNHEYEPDGTGGLFRIKNCDRDMRRVEIWYQLCWYLDSIV